MPKVLLDSIDKVTYEVLGKCGVERESVETVLETIHYANRSGIPTHGAGRLPLYVKKIKEGHFNPKDETEIVIDSGAMAVLDAKNGFGQVAAKHAMEIALDRARQFGISVVGVRNSNNFGTAGFYGDLAARNGMAAFVFANAAPAIAPTGGTERLLGTNPLCFAFPGTGKLDPVVLDMATAVAARGKIRLAAKNGEKIPLNWAIDSKGNPTDDPNEALKGALLPIAGYKGYGLSLFVDIFAGLLTGSAFAGEVAPLSQMDTDSGNGHLFVVIDIKRFMTEGELENRVARLYKAVKNCGEPGCVFLPGEPGYKKMEEQTDFVEIAEKQMQEINQIAEKLGAEERLVEV